MSNAERQSDEWEALQAVYGDDDGVLQKLSDTHWQMTLTRDTVTTTGCGGDTVATLDMKLPADYPSRQPPHIRITAPQWIVDETRLQQWQSQLVALWSPDTEALILVVEHVKELLGEQLDSNDDGLGTGIDESTGDEDVTKEDTANPTATSNQTSTTTTATRTFVPSSSKFQQPTRVFDTAIVDNAERYATTIYAGTPFHPPKSGSAELLQAFVTRVTSMEEVEWTLAHLLLENKKVAKASHNMMAYRFHRRRQNRTGRHEGVHNSNDDDDDDGTNQPPLLLVSDHDDDGEKGSGAKLAALLELTHTNDTMVIVSRWYGGIHLGPARFKWIASVARDALEECGCLGCS